MTEPTTSAQTRPLTTEEQLKKLFDRTSRLNDALSALIDPEWGAKAGILPVTHPLHPNARQEAEAERDEMRGNYQRACETIAAMHAAATGRTGEGPVRGVVEDVEDVRLRAEQAETERDGAYRERAHLVALLAAMTPGAVIAPAPDIDEPGWQIAYLTIGGRQASWHISPRDADLFAHLEAVEADDPRAQWDGHTTEEKYEGIAAYTVELMQQCGPECAEMHRGGYRCAAGRG